ncbi:glycosyltransferase [Jhaorihella thermophila]|uniref:Glycosyltransferase involved in cell wall bisynthesis n=1 Tax=Jhaorihella thermophila TaxID=488547 RepID=A0A1H5Y7L3_9RHOB|nr:glycosyltransferase [Jhaorihella thermophila]SEG19993.1 Glycosyltransferase involved in cell wall bisynthesis [Jhaorihella thermophila]
MAEARPPLVHLSPLPPMRNGIADYAAALLARLAAHYRPICVVEDPGAVDAGLDGVGELVAAEDYLRDADRFAGMRHLAHLGNNPDHGFVLDALRRNPGVVVLHDLTILYLLQSRLRRRGEDAAALAGTARRLAGEDAARLAEAAFVDRVPLMSLYAEVPGLELMRDVATAVITHSRQGEIRLRAAGFDGAVSVIPHFARVPPPRARAESRAEWRRRLGLPERGFLLASPGFVSPNKIIGVVLRALAQLPPEAGDWRYLVAGENRDPGLRGAIERLGLDNRVMVLDYLPEAAFDGVLAAADLLVNLRFPTSGEASGTVCRALAHGLPCVLSDHGWYAELPDDVAYKITPGRDAAVVEELAALLCLAMLDRRGRAEKGRRAAAFAAEMLSPVRAAAGVRAAIEATREPARGPLQGPPRP